MKTSLLLPIIATLITAASLWGSEPPVHSGQTSMHRADQSKTPAGLGDSDWSGIRAEYERHRHAIASNPDGTRQARNPG